MKKYYYAPLLILLIAACGAAPKESNSTRFNVNDSTSSMLTTPKTDKIVDSDQVYQTVSTLHEN